MWGAVSPPSWLKMMFLHSRSLWQSTTGEPSMDRLCCSSTISCLKHLELGTSTLSLGGRREGLRIGEKAGGLKGEGGKQTLLSEIAVKYLVRCEIFCFYCCLLFLQVHLHIKRFMLFNCNLLKYMLLWFFPLALIFGCSQYVLHVFGYS